MQVNIALLTVTDTRTIDTDKSGAILIKKISEEEIPGKCEITSAENFLKEI